MNYSQRPDTPTPLSSEGGYANAAGEFVIERGLERKTKSRKDLGQPRFTEDDANARYFGAFSLEAKRNVMDLLRTHPMFDDRKNVRMNRVQNNTREVMKNDPTKTSEIGGSIHYQNLPQASQKDY